MRPLPHQSLWQAPMLALAWTALPRNLGATVVGQWDFDDGNLDATVGSAMQQLGDATAIFSNSTINGATAGVMVLAGYTWPNGCSLPVADAANGGGTLVNQWTLIMDIYWPANYANRLRALIDTDQRATPDSDLFVSTAGASGSVAFINPMTIPGRAFFHGRFLP